jgi:hypothetical protein
MKLDSIHSGRSNRTLFYLLCSDLPLHVTQVFLVTPTSAMAFSPFSWIYQIIQWILDKIFSPKPPPPNAHLRRPKIAVIGAGLTGVSAASHCVGHGFDVTIFEQGSREHLGGIWSVWLPPNPEITNTYLPDHSAMLWGVTYYTRITGMVGEYLLADTCAIDTSILLADRGSASQYDLWATNS